MKKAKPTEKQKKAFKYLQTAKDKKEALLKAGYSLNTANNAKANFFEAEGYKALIAEYRSHLAKNGVTPEILADIQTEGLFDDNAQVRLQYVKETKKDLGLVEPKETIGIETNDGKNTVRVVISRGE